VRNRILPSARTLRYREITPDPLVRGYLVGYWTLDTGDDVPPGTRHRVVPDGCTDLVLVPGPDSWLPVLRGPRDTVLEVPVSAGQRFWGVRFWPDAAPLVLGVPADRLIGVVGPAGAYLGTAAADLVRSLPDPGDEPAMTAHLDRWWGRRLERVPPLDTSVRLALLAILAGGWDLGSQELGRLVALSPRQLQRRFRRATGLTLKTYARIRRLRGTIGQLLAGEPFSWSRVAANLGYSDQSHLVSEFNRLAGASPTEVARYVLAFEHVDVAG